jgi:hypothetical protein
VDWVSLLAQFLLHPAALRIEFVQHPEAFGPVAGDAELDVQGDPLNRDNQCLNHRRSPFQVSCVPFVPHPYNNRSSQGVNREGRDFPESLKTLAELGKFDRIKVHPRPGGGL